MIFIFLAIKKFELQTETDTILFNGVTSTLGAGKAIPSTKFKEKSEVTPKQAVKTERTKGVVNRA